MKDYNEKGMTLEVPLVFKIRMVNYGLSQAVFTIRILFFSFYIALCYGAGWGIGPDMGKWFYGLRIHLKRVIIGLDFGFELNMFLEWKWKHLVRKLTPEKVQQLRQILSRL